MYTREESSAIREAFWKAFGQYMALQLSAEGLRINWINYRTGIRHLQFRMEAERKQASIGIVLSDPDAGIRELMMEQFRELRPMLERHTGEAWQWEEHTDKGQGRVVSSIGTCIEGVSIFRQDDWPALISFFKPRMIALDAFWTDAQYGFELFR
ncbi:DUF4268 domain-containing protein [Taibaiella koreensis]|uniref:DUF4268 domain-containing protein n=1 Tax=Taibaiella koreensis TaxID=1268548 RepID=UPI0019695128|nr:DUF4268 domain-containing protein [Taibaiella koreensis]